MHVQKKGFVTHEQRISWQSWQVNNS